MPQCIKSEKPLLAAGLKLVTQTGAAIDDVMQGVMAEIEEYRASKMTEPTTP